MSNIRTTGYKMIFSSPKQRHLENLKAFSDPYLGLDLSMHVNKTPIHLVSQSL
jgi:hypothetical protein